MDHPTVFVGLHNGTRLLFCRLLSLESLTNRMRATLCSLRYRQWHIHETECCSVRLGREIKFCFCFNSCSRRRRHHHHHHHHHKYRLNNRYHHKCRSHHHLSLSYLSKLSSLSPLSSRYHLTYFTERSSYSF